MRRQSSGRISLIDPKMCLGCRFAKFNDSVPGDAKRRTVTCSRLDCDNWQRLDTEEGELLLLRKLLEQS
jgi:hypothetical protein